ncbi:MAG: branched-chain amino acid ABC transporter permease [Alphaproteobacteria bacterium]|nr:branched-chain amino acid ABC transporter permease [Alphaproteobacteria bacterium]
MLTFVAIGVDGLVYASWLFLVAVGLTLVLGVMRVLNVAHGSFYSFGAYAAAWGVGIYFTHGWPDAGGYFVLAGAAIVVGVILGLLIERGLLRWLYDRDEVVIVLVTYAVLLILEDAVLLIWGTDPYFAYQPSALLGNTDIAGLPFPNYNLMLIALAVLVGGILWWVLNHTHRGKFLQAVIHDREMSVFLGINVARLFTITFVIGAILGTLGGAVTAPVISVSPGIGVEVIVLAFAVVVIGGMGSVAGAIIGSLLVGLAHAAAVHLLPSVELFVIYGVMSLVLAFRPRGLFGPAQLRRI